jgi:hypothetical protein
MWAVRLVVPGLAAVPVGVLAGLVLYVAVLDVLGVDPRDRLVIRELADRYASGLRPGRL